MKLQQQKMHFGPPPLVLSIRQRADTESSYQDDNLPHSPPEISEDNVATSPTLVKVIAFLNSHLINSPIQQSKNTKASLSLSAFGLMEARSED